MEEEVQFAEPHSRGGPVWPQPEGHAHRSPGSGAAGWGSRAAISTQLRDGGWEAVGTGGGQSPRVEQVQVSSRV